MALLWSMWDVVGRGFESLQYVRCVLRMHLNDTRSQGGRGFGAARRDFGAQV